MIELLAAVALAAGPTDIPNRDSLINCLAYMAHGPEYASLSDDDLAHNDAFIDAAKGKYCSDEASPFWSIAHQKARAKLGTAADAPLSFEQQDLAEQEMQSILGEAWKEARKYRAAPNPLPTDKMARFTFSWLLDDRNAAGIMSLAEKPLQCARIAVQGRRDLNPEDMMAGMASPTFRTIGISCGYEAAQQAVAGRIKARFSEMDTDLANDIANSYLSQMTFWAALAQ